jgi:hypothetical protein
MPHRLLIAAVTLVAFLVIAPAARADWVWPVRGDVITPYRNGSDPYAGGQHRGIDIAVPVGTAVVAATGGEVRFAGTVGSSGLTVSIRTAEGRFDTSYLHLSSAAVRKGDRVASGERIGAVGTTGTRSAVAPHLHFGVRDAGTQHAYHDPLAFLPPAPVPIEHPRPAPAPGPAPAPVPQLPEAAPGRKPTPKVQPKPVPRARPTPAPRHAPVPERHPGHGRFPFRVPRPTPVAAPRARPQLGPAPHAAPRGAPGRAPGGAAADAPHGASHPVPGTARDARAGRAPSSASQPALDPGYALACVGLLLAAALLGLSEDGRHASRRAGRHGRHLIASTLRPLLGRRP